MSFRRLVWPVFGAGVLVVVLAVGVFPTRTYLDQRDQIAAEEAKVRILDAENQKLAARVTELHTDAEIERLAREQYNLVRPGEEAYAILPGRADPEPPAPQAAPEVPAPRDRSWWDDVADRITFWD